MQPLPELAHTNVNSPGGPSMNEEVVAVFIPIVAIVMSLGIPIIYQILDYRRRRDVVEAHHKERMAAIERGRMEGLSLSH